MLNLHYNRSSIRAFLLYFNILSEKTYYCKERYVFNSRICFNAIWHLMQFKLTSGLSNWKKSNICHQKEDLHYTRSSYNEEITQTLKNLKWQTFLHILSVPLYEKCGFFLFCFFLVSIEKHMDRSINHSNINKQVLKWTRINPLKMWIL